MTFASVLAASPFWVALPLQLAAILAAIIFPAMVLAYIIAMGSEAKTATYSHAAQTLEPLTGNVVSREIQKAFPRSFGFHITSRIIVYAGADDILVERDWIGNSETSAAARCQAWLVTLTDWRSGEADRKRRLTPDTASKAKDRASIGGSFG
jgi:hypothetical protein